MNNNYGDEADAIEIIDLDTLDQKQPHSEKIYLTSRSGRHPTFKLRRTPIRLGMFALTLLGCIFLLTALWPDITFKLSPLLVWNAILAPTPTALSLTPVLSSQQRYASVVTGNGVAYIYSYAFQNTESGSLDAVSIKNGTRIWSRQNISTLSAPVLIKNVLYLSSLDGIDALRARDGSLLWHQYIGQDIICISNNILYTNAYIRTGVYALHISDGSILWYNSSVTNIQSPDDCSASTKVFLATMTTTAGQSTVALNIANGLVLWQYQSSLMIHFKQVNTVTNITSDNDQQASLSGKNLDGTVRWHYGAIKQLWSTDEGDLYIQQSNGSVAALRPNDGSVLWQQSMIDGIQAKDKGILYTSFAASLYLRHASDGSAFLDVSRVGPDNIFVRDGMCFIPTPGVLLAVNTHKAVPTFLWHISTDGHISAVSGSNIYLFTDFQDKPIVALNTSNGKELWHYTVSNPGEQTGYFISATADTVYISSPLYSIVTALRSKDGTQLWHYHLPL